MIWETIGGKVFEMLLKHLAPKGRMVVIGGITGYKEVGFPQVALSDLPGRLVMNSWSLTGFLLTSEEKRFPEYLPILIGDIMSGKLKITCDIGKNSPGGEFKGIEDAVRGVEVCSLKVSNGL